MATNQTTADQTTADQHDDGTSVARSFSSVNMSSHRRPRQTIDSATRQDLRQEADSRAVPSLGPVGADIRRPFPIQYSPGGPALPATPQGPGAACPPAE